MGSEYTAHNGAEKLLTKLLGPLFDAGWRCMAPVRYLEHVQQRTFDRLYKVSTIGIVVTNNHDFAEGGDYCAYDGCQWFPLRRALKKLSPGRDDVFVDLGSGKGKSLLIAGRFPYRRVLGVELNEELSRTANVNIRKTKSRMRAGAVESINDSVLGWPVDDESSVIFLYNPFVGNTFHETIKHIFESYDRNPRSLHIVYDYPWEHDWLIGTGRVVVEDVISRAWPGRLRWWQDGNVIVTYRVMPSLAHEFSGPERRARLVRPRLAMKKWSDANGQVFQIKIRDSDPVRTNS